MARKLQSRLALAQFKASKGWEDFTLDVIEPKIDEELRRKRANLKGDLLADSSSRVLGIQHPRFLMDPPLKCPAIFSDAFDSRTSTSRHRKLTDQTSCQYPSSIYRSRKGFRKSTSAIRPADTGYTAWKYQQRLAQSSHMKPQSFALSTISTGPSICLFCGSLDIAHKQSQTLAPAFAVDDDTLQKFPPQLKPSSCRSHSLNRGRPNSGIVGSFNDTNKANSKPTERGAELYLCLGTSFSPSSTAATNHDRYKFTKPPSTSPARGPALSNSMNTTPGASSSEMLGAVGLYTPSKNFDFADFVNITPGPAQSSPSRTPKSLPPATVAGKRLSSSKSLPSPTQERDRSGNDQRSET